jgi:hypothetical protein
MGLRNRNLAQHRCHGCRPSTRHLRHGQAESEEDAFNMLGSAIVDAVADDPAHTAALFDVWEELVEQRKLS